MGLLHRAPQSVGYHIFFPCGHVAGHPCCSFQPSLVALLQKWVGTTEAAALFRSFGLRARIVDFGTQRSQAAAGAAAAAAAAGRGSALPVHPNVECDGCGVCPIVGDRFRSETRPDFDLCAACHASPAAAEAEPFRKMLPSGVLGAGGGGPCGAGGSAAGPPGSSAGSGSSVAQQLLLWVWRYFASEDGGSGGGDGGPAAAAAAAAAEEAGEEGRTVKRLRLQQSAVRLSGKSPLYFQVGGLGMWLVMANKPWHKGSVCVALTRLPLLPMLLHLVLDLQRIPSTHARVPPTPAARGPQPHHRGHRAPAGGCRAAAPVHPAHPGPRHLWPRAGGSPIQPAGLAAPAAAGGAHPAACAVPGAVRGPRAGAGRGARGAEDCRSLGALLSGRKRLHVTSPMPANVWSICRCRDCLQPRLVEARPWGKRG